MFVFIKKIIFLIALFFISHSTTTHSSIQNNNCPTTVFKTDHPNNHHQSIIRIRNNPNPHSKSGTYSNLVQIPSDDFNNIFKQVPAEYEILGNLELFANQHFRNYACTLSSYEDFILWLHNKIKDDKNFRVPGFEYSFSVWGKTKSEFHELIKTEATRIIDERKERKLHEKPRLCVTDYSALEKLRSMYSSLDSMDQKLTDRWQQRTHAIKKTIDCHGICFDYSSQVQPSAFTDPYADVFEHCYGTELDKQLHEELCGTRIIMLELQDLHTHNVHVHSFAPIVYRVTALAKKQQHVEQAFNLSDFAYDLVRIASQGVSAAGRGIIRGAKTALDPHRWPEMCKGLLTLDIFLADEYAQLEDLDRALFSSIISDDPTVFLEQSDAYVQHSQAQTQVFKKPLQQLKKMSWEELVEHGFHFGTTFILDGVILKAATLCASSAGRALIRNLAEALNSPLAKEYRIEVAGVGKIALEDGTKAAHKIAEIIKENPKFTVSNISTVVQRARDIDNLLKAGNLLDKGGLTMAGRALQKHGSRTKSMFPKAIGNVSAINAQGEDVLKEILTNPNVTSVIRHHARFGDILEYKILGGQGARFSSDGNTFIGFIEP